MRHDTAAPVLQPPQLTAAQVYNATASHFDDPAVSFWDTYGRATVDRMDLRPGASVLDAGCGTGASALPAAEAVGASGDVLAVDIADSLLALGREKAQARGLNHIRFQAADMTELDFPAGRFDAVVSVFSIFFVPDRARQIELLWRLVRPGGQLAVTTWGPGLCEPLAGHFWQAAGEVRPDLVRGFNPWDDITTPDALRDLLAAGGIGIYELAVTAELGRHPVADPSDWWKIVLGSGFRGTIEAMSGEQSRHVQEACAKAMHREKITSVETNVVFALAKKPPLPSDP